MVVDFACQVETLKTCAIENPIILEFQEHSLCRMKPQFFPRSPVHLIMVNIPFLPAP